MKKIFRVICRILLEIILMIATIAIDAKIIYSENNPGLVSILLFLLSTSSAILLSVILLSNPTVKFSYNKRPKIKKGKKTQDFIQLCNKLKIEYNDILECYRIKAILYLTLITLVVVFSLFLAALSKNFEFSLLIEIAVVSLLINLYVKNRNKFTNEFKNGVMLIMIKNICSTLQYDYTGGDDIFNAYNSIAPNDKETNGYESSDYIYGEMKGIDLEICKISLINYSEKSGEKINTVETFLLSRNSINFSSSSTIFLKPNNYFYTHNINRIQMDSENFEKYFDIFSDSNMLTMQVFTHDVMEELVLFYTQYRCKFEIIIKNNKLFIKFKTGDVFNPKILKSATNSDLLWTYYTILNFITRFCIKINKSLEETEI